MFLKLKMNKVVQIDTNQSQLNILIMLNRNSNRFKHNSLLLSDYQIRKVHLDSYYRKLNSK